MDTATAQEATLTEIMALVNSGRCTVRERMRYLCTLRQGELIASARIEAQTLVVFAGLRRAVVPNLVRIECHAYASYDRISVWAQLNGRPQLVLQLSYPH